MKVSVHVAFNGQCADALANYARILDGTIVFQLKYGDSPMAGSVPADWQDKLCHATMTLGDLTLMGADVFGANYQAPQGIWLAVHPQTPDDARRIFAELAGGGQVQMPMQETFWSAAFGVVTDRYGVRWEINCEGEMT